MSMGVALESLGEVLTDYAASLRDHLVLKGRPVQVVVDVAPGVTPAWDSSCSQIYGRVVQMRPIIDQNWRPGLAGCGVAFYEVTAALAVTRCVKTAETGGRRVILPAPAQVTADGLAMVLDAADIEAVVRCHPHTRSLVSGQPLPEMGGMAGFEWTYTLRGIPCPCSTLIEA